MMPTVVQKSFCKCYNINLLIIFYISLLYTQIVKDLTKNIKQQCVFWTSVVIFVFKVLLEEWSNKSTLTCRVKYCFVFLSSNVTSRIQLIIAKSCHLRQLFAFYFCTILWVKDLNKEIFVAEKNRNQFHEASKHPVVVI